MSEATSAAAAAPVWFTAAWVADAVGGVEVADAQGVPESLVLVPVAVEFP